jgi:hypothetical protein
MDKRADVGKREDNIRSPDEIRRRIRIEREIIAETVSRLNGKFRKMTDGRALVSEHPFAALGGSAALGFWLAGLLKPRRPSPAEQVADSLCDTIDAFNARLAARERQEGSARIRSMVGSIVFAAALDFLMVKITEGISARRQTVEEEVFKGEGLDANERLV